MAKSSGCNLLNGCLRARQPDCVVFCREVSDKGRDAVVGPQESERFLEEGGLSGAGARDQTHHVYSGIVEALPELASHYVVLLENVLSYFHQAGLRTHSCISKATT